MASSWGGIMAAQMGWAAAADDGWRKGPWTAEEDKLLIDYVKQHGEGRWNSVSRITGLKRNGKSCRLRWVNYLRPDLKRGQITPQEENIILDLHARWGNRWSTIARSLPGRTDNEIKNYWRTHFKKKPKTSTNNVEKLRARLLRKQQFHQQQQQQQQQQEYEFNELDMKKILSLLEDNDDRVIPSNSLPQMATSATTIVSDEQSGFYPIAAANNGSGSEGSVDHRFPHYHHEMPWEGLWSLEDVQGGYNALCGANKQANFLQHFVSPFY